MLDLDRREWTEIVVVLATATLVTLVLFTALSFEAADKRANYAAERAGLLNGECGPRILDIETALGTERRLSNDEARSMRIRWIANESRSQGAVGEARAPVGRTD